MSKPKTVILTLKGPPGSGKEVLMEDIITLELTKRGIPYEFMLLDDVEGHTIKVDLTKFIHEMFRVGR
jgi:hypothetical protein